MWAGTFPGTAYITNHFASLYLIPNPGFNPIHMSVKGLIAKSVIDYHPVTMSARTKPCIHHFSIAGSINGGAQRGCKINSFMCPSVFIYRINPIPKTRTNAGKIFIADWLNRGHRCQPYFLILNQTGNFIEGFQLIGF